MVIFKKHQALCFIMLLCELHHQVCPLQFVASFLLQSFCSSQCRVFDAKMHQIPRILMHQCGSMTLSEIGWQFRAVWLNSWTSFWFLPETVDSWGRFRLCVPGMSQKIQGSNFVRQEFEPCCQWIICYFCLANSFCAGGKWKKLGPPLVERTEQKP